MGDRSRKKIATNDSPPPLPLPAPDKGNTVHLRQDTPATPPIPQGEWMVGRARSTEIQRAREEAETIANIAMAERMSQEREEKRSQDTDEDSVEVSTRIAAQECKRLGK